MHMCQHSVAYILVKFFGGFSGYVGETANGEELVIDMMGPVDTITSTFFLANSFRRCWVVEKS